MPVSRELVKGAWDGDGKRVKEEKTAREENKIPV
jgi:hypothetical protein